jgi:TRAP transporter TAXI family solute receptor
VLVLGHPNGLVQRATGLCDAQLLALTGPAVEALVEGSGAYHAATIPARIYGGHPGSIPSFGGEALVVTLADEPDERVYRLTRSILEQVDILSRLHPALSELTAERLAPGAGLLPIHPGSARYLRERGLIE